MNYNQQQQYLNDYLVEANVLQDPNTMTYNKSVITNNNNAATTPNSNDSLPLNSNRNSSIQSDNGLLITGNSSSTTNVSPTNNTNATNSLLTNGLPITINTTNNNPAATVATTTAATATGTILPINNNTTNIKNVNKSNGKLPMNLTMNGSIENSNNNSSVNNTNTNNNSNTFTNDSTTMDTNDIEFQNHNNNNNNNSNNGRTNNISNYNKQLYMMNMTNNPHLINDASIQETLSPYFQPFGVDVAHLPMTNPPIFQSSLPVYDEPVPRRRISISNGQISQLGEDIETVENLYNTQPPPLPRYHDNSYNTNKQMINMSQQVTPAQDTMYVPQQVIPNNQNIRPKQESITSIGYATNNNSALGPTDINMRQQLPQQQYQQHVPQQQMLQQQQNIRQTIPPQQQMNNATPYTQQVNYRTDNPIVMKQQPVQSTIPDGISPATVPTQIEPSNRHSMSDITYQDKRIKQEYNEPSNLSNIPSQPPSQPQSQQKNYNPYPSYNRSDEGTPGTTAWKRARLLERNRIAASKCRQRKKVAQLQLQIDYDKINKENIILKKKLVYYEKLISKFKKFTESHFNTCHKTSGSVNDDDKNALKIIQEMLMIDEDIHEVNDNGKIIKLSVKDPSPTIPRSPSQLDDSDGLLDMEGN